MEAKWHDKNVNFMLSQLIITVFLFLLSMFQYACVCVFFFIVKQVVILYLCTVITHFLTTLIFYLYVYNSVSYNRSLSLSNNILRPPQNKSKQYQNDYCTSLLNILSQLLIQFTLLL